MTSGIRIQLFTHGEYLYGEAPFRIDIVNSELNSVESRLVTNNDTPEFTVQPGIYAVTATAPSGAHVQRVVEAEDNQTVDCVLPVHQISPHEDHEWAYITQKLESPYDESKKGAEPRRVRTLDDEEFNNAWVRIWRREGNAYRIVQNKLNRRTWGPDGVIFSADTEDKMQCIQIGGPDVPWKCVAFPPSHADTILVRPSPSRGGHPLEVVISSGNLALDGLMSLLQRGEIQQATLVEENQARLAERFLFHKHSDPAAAAVGGYYLLRINDLRKLHDWANNLANRFGWLPDGAIIHAWQLIAEYRSDQTRFSGNLEIARDRLLETIDRGFPIYTEGLRLLRDGLFLFEQQSNGEDDKVHEALLSAGEYVAAADWSVPLTTFMGISPDKPSLAPEIGTPDSRQGLDILY